jgi:hypothetical protein
LKIIAAIEDPPVIDKVLGHLGLPTHPPPRSRLVESIYSKRSEQSKLLPTQADGATRSNSERTAP